MDEQDTWNGTFPIKQEELPFAFEHYYCVSGAAEASA